MLVSLCVTSGRFARGTVLIARSILTKIVSDSEEFHSLERMVQIARKRWQIADLMTSVQQHSSAVVWRVCYNDIRIMIAIQISHYTGSQIMRYINCTIHQDIFITWLLILMKNTIFRLEAWHHNNFKQEIIFNLLWIRCISWEEIFMNPTLE